MCSDTALHLSHPYRERKSEREFEMGSGNSRMVSGQDRRNRPQKSRWPTVKRTVSSILVCGASSSRSPNEIEDYPAELLVNSTVHDHQQKLKFARTNSGLSLSDRVDPISINSENKEVGPSNVEPSAEGKGLSQSRELVPSRSVANSRNNQTASTSHLDQTLDCASVNEVVNRINNVTVDLSQVGETAFSHGHGEVSDDVSVENRSSQAIDFSNVVSEREQNQQDGGLLQVDVLGISSRILSGNSSERSNRHIRRNSRRLFWDSFSRRSFRRHTDSRTFIFSPDNLESHDRWLLDFDGDILNDGSRSRGSNEQQWNSRSQIWERLLGGLESTNHRNEACPRGIHADGRCLCQSSLSVVESGAHAGVSRVVMLAEALFEVLDQMHQQPMSLSLSMVSLLAPESVVDSFPVKTHRNTEKSERADDVSQCYICLSEYAEGDKIRVLPCHHEYHSSCVDKWLKEIHGVCPLCRGDVRDGSTETHVQIE